jgi:pilus assembly protein CpaE/pilus assembly protein CpaF
MARAKTIAVTSASGGVGKTLVATNLALSQVQQEGGRVLLVDGGYPLPGEAAALLGLDRAKVLAEMIPILGRLTPEVFASYLVTARAGAAVLPLVNDVLQAPLITPAVLDQFFGLANDAFDHIIIDLPSGANALTAPLLERVDYVVLVFDATPAGVTRAGYALHFLRSLQFPSSSVLLCLNKVGTGSDAAEQARRVLGVRIAVTLPEGAEIVMQAASRGKPLIEAAPRHAIIRGIDELARELSRLGLRDIDKRARAATAQQPDEEAAMRREFKLAVHRRLVEEVEMRKADLTYLRDPVKLQEMRTRVESKIIALVEEEAPESMTRAVRRQLVKELLDEALGLGPLEDLLADPTITEIMVNRPDQIYVEKNGRLELTKVQFLNVEQVRGIIERIVAPLGRRIDEKVPMVDARLRDGSRVNAIIPPLALKGPALTIRKFAKKLLGVSDLVKYGTLTDQMATFLGAAVHARLNIVISGGTGSGKTTLLNVLASFIPNDERIVTIEDAAELQLPQEHLISLESRPANIEGEGAITIRDLVRNSLRMRPDRIVVGECRAGEALDMLQAMNTGHDGSLTTLHANTPSDALSRLETMSLMAGLELPSRAIRDQIASAVNLVVQQTRLQDGSRRITYITEIKGQENGEFVSEDVFLFQQTGLTPDGRVLGQFLPTGYVPSFIDRISKRGIRVPREIFLHQTA